MKKVYEFEGKAKQYPHGVAVDTDGLSLSNDDFRYKAFELEKGKNYKIVVYEID